MTHRRGTFIFFFYFKMSAMVAVVGIGAQMVIYMLIKLKPSYMRYYLTKRGRGLDMKRGRVLDKRQFSKVYTNVLLKLNVSGVIKNQC